MPPLSHVAVWAIAAITILAILIRPRGIPEWVWAVCGAAMLLVTGLLPLRAAVTAVAGGLDVYLFLAGMLALSELARVEGVFDWIAARIVPAARGSTAALFGGVYLVGVAVTALLSNDGTILLLTPAVLAATRRAGITPLPFLYACAFVANAASFVLPISNPANLVLFDPLPSLIPWLTAFGLASVAAVACTGLALAGLNRRALAIPYQDGGLPHRLAAGGRYAAFAVACSSIALVVCAGLGWPVGFAAFILGALSLLGAGIVRREAAWSVLRESPWSIVPLVASLFAIVAALDRSGVLASARGFFRGAGGLPVVWGNFLSGGAVAAADNVLNNLPVGVLARYSLHAPHVHVPAHIAHAVLVALDLGPNFSVTGSLATLLWLITLRRERIEVTPWQFLTAGAAVTLPALAFALLLVR